jgi:hypothetical protein
VKKGPIGVWFSLALAILATSVWAGWKAGGTVAVCWHHVHPEFADGLTRAQRTHLEAELSDLTEAELLNVISAARASAVERGKQYPPIEISRLEALRSRTKTDEMKPVIDLQVGLAYLLEAIGEARDNNTETAAKYMSAAQPLFQSLGWHNYSREALEAVGESYLNPRHPVPEGAK